MNPQLQRVFIANGEIHAQQIRAFLEAAGITAIERGESLRNTHGLTLDGLGAVEILVAEVDAGRARSLLDSAEAGTFRLAEDVDNSSVDDDGVSEELRDFATRYTAAWCSRNAASVAGFFAATGSLTINDAAPAVGRAAIAAAAQGFMTAFPDMAVLMDDIGVQGDRAVYRWTLTGTNTGPGGTGKAVRISGYEEWRLGADGLIAESTGHFDEVEYQRQLQTGI